MNHFSKNKLLLGLAWNDERKNNYFFVLISLIDVVIDVVVAVVVIVFIIFVLHESVICAMGDQSFFFVQNYTQKRHFCTITDCT